MYTFERIAEILDDMVDALPQDVLKDLSGVYLDHQVKHNEKIPSDSYYVMGEYVVDPYLGKRIELHYGSIEAVHGNLVLTDMQNELHRILMHELRHHLETLAGCDDLMKADDEYVRDALARLNQTGKG